VVGREKVCSLAFADDLVIVTKSEREMKEMMTSLGKYVRKKSWQWMLRRKEWWCSIRERGRMKRMIGTGKEGK
jgi:hypothetical protein